MMARSDPAELWGFEPFGLSVGMAVIAGALSVLIPWLQALVGVLVTLALAGWASLHAAGRTLGHGDRGRFGGAVATFSGGVLLFVWSPGALAAWRGLLLALALVPLWVAERHGRGTGRRGG